MRRQNKAIHPDKNKKKQTADNRLRPWAVAVWLAVWELASLYIGQEILLVSPVSVLRRLTVLAVQSDFWGSIAFSFFRIIGGFLLASLCGTLLASLSAAFRFVRDLLAPAMAAIKAVPVASFIILVLIWVPSRNLSVVISFLMVLPVIYTNVLGGILSTDRKLLEMAQVFRIPLFRRIRSAPARSAIVSAFIIVLSMTISLVGLSNIIKYGYGYCGYLAIAIVVVPFLTAGVYKNRKYIKAHPACKGK